MLEVWRKRQEETTSNSVQFVVTYRVDSNDVLPRVLHNNFTTVKSYSIRKSPKCKNSPGKCNLGHKTFLTNLCLLRYLQRWLITLNHDLYWAFEIWPKWIEHHKVKTPAWLLGQIRVSAFSEGCKRRAKRLVVGRASHRRKQKPSR